MSDNGDQNQSDGHDKKDKGEQADQNVVPFPTHKVRKPKGKGGPTLGRPGSSQSRRVTLFMSLLLTVLMATLVTNQINERRDKSLKVVADRIIQSESDSFQRRDLEEDILLAKKIARESLREPASAGREPTAEDVLRHSVLRNMYALNFSEKGALRGLELNSTAGVTDSDMTSSGGSGDENRGSNSDVAVESRSIGPRDKFIENQRDMLKVPFDKVALSNAFEDEQYRYEIWDLKMNDKVNASVHFVLGKSGYLKSMRVELTNKSADAM